MAGNATGVLFRVATWGESHGPAVGAVIDGCPPGIDLSEADIRRELDRRRPGKIASASPRREMDRVEILSGLFEGKTTGTPISLLIRNRDADSSAYDGLRDLFRPGHGDITYQAKYGIRDHRGGGRASGRETAARVAAGAIARKVIGQAGISVVAFTACWEESSPHPFPRPRPRPAPSAALTRRRRSGWPGGWRKRRPKAIRSAGSSRSWFAAVRPASASLSSTGWMRTWRVRSWGSGRVKGVEIGAGFAAARNDRQRLQRSDRPGGFLTNHAGGILAGITSGDEIVIRVACKPIPSISRPQQTVDVDGNPAVVTISGRHDVSVIPRIIPVCEAMVCMVLADHLLRQRAITHGNDHDESDFTIGIIGGTRGVGKWFADFFAGRGMRSWCPGGRMDRPFRSSQRPAGSSSWPSPLPPRSRSSVPWGRSFRKRRC